MQFRLAKLESFKDLMLSRSKWLGSVNDYKLGGTEDTLMEGMDINQ
jgi:hypothetical protein